MVLDCSVVMSWCFEDEGNPYADEIFQELAERDAIVPTIWPLEVANVLAVAERRRKINEPGILRFIEWLGALNLKVDKESPDRALGGILALAREHRLSSYDASYLELAMRMGAALATLDKDLRAAAKKAGVSLANA